jgi:hypothetical protein
VSSSALITDGDLESVLRCFRLPVRDQLGQACVQDLARSDNMPSAIRQVLVYCITEGLIAINVAASVKASRKQHSDSRPRDRLAARGVDQVPRCR